MENSYLKKGPTAKINLNGPCLIVLEKTVVLCVIDKKPSQRVKIQDLKKKKNERKIWP